MDFLKNPSKQVLGKVLFMSAPSGPYYILFSIIDIGRQREASTGIIDLSDSFFL